MARFVSIALAALGLAIGAPAVAALPVGAVAPDFTTQASLAGTPFEFHLADALKKGPVVLYFFPAAFTEGCTFEAHEFAEATEEFAKLGATVIGVSADNIEKLNKFSVSECRNKFAVASASGKVISAYQVKLPVLEKSNRTSFLIAPDGKIVSAYSDLSYKEHVTRMMSAVKEWRAAHP